MKRFHSDNHSIQTARGIEGTVSNVFPITRRLCQVDQDFTNEMQSIAVWVLYLLYSLGFIHIQCDSSQWRRPIRVPAVLKLQGGAKCGGDKLQQLLFSHLRRKSHLKIWFCLARPTRWKKIIIFKVIPQITHITSTRRPQ